MVFTLVSLSHPVMLCFGLHKIKKKIPWRFNSSNAWFRGSWYGNSFDYVALAFYRIILSSRYLEQDVDLPSVYEAVLYFAFPSSMLVRDTSEASKAFVSKFYSRSLVYFFDLERARDGIHFNNVSFNHFIFAYSVCAFRKFILTWWSNDERNVYLSLLIIASGSFH